MQFLPAPSLALGMTTYDDPLYAPGRWNGEIEGLAPNLPSGVRVVSQAQGTRIHLNNLQFTPQPQARTRLTPDNGLLVMRRDVRILLVGDGECITFQAF